LRIGESGTIEPPTRDVPFVDQQVCAHHQRQLAQMRVGLAGCQRIVGSHGLIDLALLREERSLAELRQRRIAARTLRDNIVESLFRRHEIGAVGQ
jgi:hypothetical protein